MINVIESNMELLHALERFRMVHKKTEKTPRVVCDSLSEEPNMAVSRRLHGAMGMSGEAGEVLEKMKKQIFGYKREEIPPKVVLSELGDVFWYFALMADAYGFTLSDILEYNANKLIERYPEKFTEEEVACAAQSNNQA